ncbi:MAG TPA: hypothetical protein PLD27_13245, partial [bacterium]|nr:hypothetical protein [bacterium]
MSTRIDWNGDLYLKFRIDLEEGILYLKGNEYDSSQVEYIKVIYNSEEIPLSYRLDGNYIQCDTSILIDTFPADGSSCTFVIKLNGNSTLYYSKAKYKKGIINPLQIIKPVANSIGDSSADFAWTTGSTEQDSLIVSVYLSIWCWGESFNWFYYYDKWSNPNASFTSYDTELSYPASAEYILNISVRDNYGNEAAKQISFYPLPGDGTISGTFTFQTNSTNAEVIGENQMKTYLLLYKWENSQKVLIDSKVLDLSGLNSGTTSKSETYSFTQLFNNWYDLVAFLDINKNNIYDTGELINNNGVQVSSDTKNPTMNITLNFYKTFPPNIFNFQINNNEQYTKTTSILLQFNANADFGDTYLMDTLYYQVIDDKETSSWTIWSGAPVAWTLSETDGLKNITLNIKDFWGNISSQNGTITLDRTAPTITNFILNNGIDLTKTTNIQLSFSYNEMGSGLYDTIILSGDLVNSGETNYITPKNIILSSSSGLKTISALFADNAGNTVVVSDTIILDNEGPDFTFTPVIWADTTQAIEIPFTVTDLYANIDSVKLFYVDMDVAAEMGNLIKLVKNGSNTTLSETFIIPSRTANDSTNGYVYYYLEASDSLVNKTYYTKLGKTTVAPTEISDLIQLQRIDFSAPVINISEGEYTNTRNCTVQITEISKPSSRLVSGKIYGDIESEVIISDTGVTSYSIQLTEANGVKTIYCVYVDENGNTSPAGSATVYYDNVAPIVSLQIGTGNITNSTVQVLTITYNDSTARKDTITIETSSNISSTKGDTTVYPIPVILTSGDGEKTVSVKIYDSAGNYSVASDTIILDQSGPSITMTPVTWADTTQEIEIPVSIEDAYSNILEIAIKYIEMDSAADTNNLIEIVQIFNTAIKNWSGSCTIPARVATSADSGDVYYYIIAADSWMNFKFYTAYGETTVEPTSVNNLIKLKRQDLTPLSVNPLTYADNQTKTIASRTIEFNGTFGVSDKANTLYVYNSET